MSSAAIRDAVLDDMRDRRDASLHAPTFMRPEERALRADLDRQIENRVWATSEFAGRWCVVSVHPDRAPVWDRAQNFETREEAAEEARRLAIRLDHPCVGRLVAAQIGGEEPAWTDAS